MTSVKVRRAAHGVQQLLREAERRFEVAGIQPAHPDAPERPQPIALVAELVARSSASDHAASLAPAEYISDHPSAASSRMPRAAAPASSVPTARQRPFDARAALAHQR